MKARYYLTKSLGAGLLVVLMGCAQIAPSFRTPASFEQASAKEKIKQVRAQADRKAGLVQLTGKEIVLGQTKFPERTPADPTVFEDEKTGEVHVYGTQVDGTGFSYLKYKSKNDLLRGAKPERVEREVYLPNGQKMEGKEAIWDTYRLAYKVLVQVFGKKKVAAFYKEHGISPETDLYFGGIALQDSGELGRWTQDNWRRRVHAMAEINGHLQILSEPVFNPIKATMSEKNYPGFGLLPFLPGDYIGHAYGPNFKLVKKNGKLEMWIISEEVTRRYQVPERVPAEVTEIMARKMENPLQASEETVLMVSVDDKDGKPHPDSDRGKEMAHTYLIEGFRPTSLTEEGIVINKKEVSVDGQTKLVTDKKLKTEYFLLTGSPGNFAGDDYDAIVAFRKKSAIGQHEIIQERGSESWKRFLNPIKKKYGLSWAGRGTFVKDDGGEWWLLFHGVDKDLKPDGSYGGVIPPNTEEYHRNLYAVPVDFYINIEGKPDMQVLQ